ncbi:MAG: TonB family protein [Acidobacteria bacterium]|nr:TonB family protein [Acidobacteriota bacterium]
MQVAINPLMAILLAATLFGQTPPPHPDRSDQKIKARLNKMLAIAKADREKGDWAGAISVLQDATTLDPSRDLLWAKLGEAYQGANNYQEAATAYRKAIVIKPIGAYYNNLGEAYVKLRMTGEAVQAYKNAVAVDSTAAYQYYFNIGAILTNTGDLEQANAAYSDSIRLNPQFAMAYYFKGTNLLSKAQVVHAKATVPDEALQLLHRYLELQPTGAYAIASHQVIAFLSRDIRTTYTRQPTGEQPENGTRTLSQSEAQSLPIWKVQPVYPELARNIRIQGQVILDALIAKDGTVLSLSALSGNPLLIESALDAVQQWRFKPDSILGMPVRMRTQVRVEFVLER